MHTYRRLNGVFRAQSNTIEAIKTVEIEFRIRVEDHGCHGTFFFANAALGANFSFYMLWRNLPRAEWNLPGNNKQ